MKLLKLFFLLFILNSKPILEKDLNKASIVQVKSKKTDYILSYAGILTGLSIFTFILSNAIKNKQYLMIDSFQRHIFLSVFAAFIPGVSFIFKKRICKKNKKDSIKNKVHRVLLSSLALTISFFALRAFLKEYKQVKEIEKLFKSLNIKESFSVETIPLSIAGDVWEELHIKINSSSKEMLNLAQKKYNFRKDLNFLLAIGANLAGLGIDYLRPVFGYKSILSKIYKKR